MDTSDLVWKDLSVIFSIVGIVCLSIFHFGFNQDISSDTGAIFGILTIGFLGGGLSSGILLGFKLMGDSK